MRSQSKYGTLLGAAVAWGLATGLTQAAEPIQALPPTALDWETTPEGVAFAPLDGARFEGPYMAMVRLPGGLHSPPHVKTANMFGVMVSGEMIHHGLDQDPAVAPVLAQGAFYRIPAGVPHISACVSDADCVTFLYQDGAFDFLPVQP